MIVKYPEIPSDDDDIEMIGLKTKLYPQFKPKEQNVDVNSDEDADDDHTEEDSSESLLRQNHARPPAHSTAEKRWPQIRGIVIEVYCQLTLTATLSLIKCRARHLSY
jgi:hypothetical protein